MPRIRRALTPSGAVIAAIQNDSFRAREAIVQHLEDLEDIYLAEQRLVDHRKGSGETVSKDEMRRHLALDD